MPNVDPAWIEYQKTLPNGATFTRLRSAPLPNDDPTVTCGHAKRLVRVGGMTLALRASEAQFFDSSNPTQEE